MASSMGQRAALRKIAKTVVRMNQVKRVHRVRATAITLTAATQTAVLLLKADSTPNYDVTSDGTTPAECQTGARIQSIQLHGTFYLGASDTIVEWNLFKNPDAVATAAISNVASIYTADVSANTLMMRKASMAAGHIVFGSGSDKLPLNVRIAGKALRRNGLMAEEDRLQFTFDNLDATDDVFLYLRGRIITRGP